MNSSLVKTGFTFFLLLFVTALFILTIDLGRVAALVPIKVVIPTLGLLIFQFVLDLVPGLAEKFSRFDKLRFVRSEQLEKESRTYSSESKPEESRGIREKRAFIWFLLLFLFILFFGVMTAVPLFTFLYIRRRAEEGWLFSIGMAAGMGVLIQGVFVILLRTRLYEGLLWTWLGF